ncbi:hypothetical protein OMCYN_00302 [cyanobiont of Ornithocercus magnificus]|nr:hypothetical protein OMCYN_00302 [cyanobiont of Ornithocercus magnificus]
MSWPPDSLDRHLALQMMETSYLAATAALIWLGLYYLPIGGALLRLALPLPLALLILRHGCRAGLEGIAVAVLLLAVLMGPVRGPLILFPYGFLSLWLGWGWRHQCSWWFTLIGGLLIGVVGFLIRVFALSLLVGENLWLVINRTGAALLDRLADFLQLSFAADLSQIQLMAFLLILVQQLIYTLALHTLAFWIFPRLQTPIPDPPQLLYGLIVLDLP